jgi:hypothetical protein
MGGREDCSTERVKQKGRVPVGGRRTKESAGSVCEGTGGKADEVNLMEYEKKLELLGEQKRAGLVRGDGREEVEGLTETYGSRMGWSEWEKRMAVKVSMDVMMFGK